VAEKSEMLRARPERGCPVVDCRVSSEIGERESAVVSSETEKMESETRGQPAGKAGEWKVTGV